MIGTALVVVAGAILVTAPSPRTEWSAFGGLFIVLGSAAFVGEWFLSFLSTSYLDVVPFPPKSPLLSTSHTEKSRADEKSSGNAA